jgi:hypothetical protein
MINISMENTELKSLPWKSGVLPPPDARRPRCRIIYSYNGTTGYLDEDETDLVDWLITIAYETEPLRE